MISDHGDSTGDILVEQTWWLCVQLGIFQFSISLRMLLMLVISSQLMSRLVSNA